MASAEGRGSCAKPANWASFHPLCRLNQLRGGLMGSGEGMLSSPSSIPIPSSAGTAVLGGMLALLMLPPRNLQCCSHHGSKC